MSKLEELIKAYNVVINKKQSVIDGTYKEINMNLSHIYKCIQRMYYVDTLDGYEFEETGCDLSRALEDTFKYLSVGKNEFVKENKNKYSLYTKLKNELENEKSTTEIKNIMLLLYNDEYSDYDSPVSLFKYIVDYVRVTTMDKIKTKKEITNIYRRDFDEIYDNAYKTKQEKVVWSNNIRNKAYSYLYDLFKNNRSDAVKYVYALRNIDKKADFFWDVLDRKDIINEIAR